MDAEIFLYNRAIILQLTNNSEMDWHAHVNNNGHVVWEGDYRPNVYANPHSNIFLYNGSSITKLTDNWEQAGRQPAFTLDDVYPWINNTGQVVWKAESEYLGSDTEIYLYDGSMTFHYDWAGFGLPLTSNDYRNLDPQINDNGYVVLYGNEGGEDSKIFLYNDSIINQLTDNLETDYRSLINNIGEIVWEGNDGTDYEIFLYDGYNVTNLSDNRLFEDYATSINDAGNITWFEKASGGSNDKTEIFLYNGTTIGQLITNNYADVWPKINSEFYIVWERYDDTDWEIVLYTGTNVIQLTNNSYDDNNPQINNNGGIVWQGFNGTDWEIFFATVDSLITSSTATPGIVFTPVVPPTATRITMATPISRIVTFTPIVPPVTPVSSSRITLTPTLSPIAPSLTPVRILTPSPIPLVTLVSSRPPITPITAISTPSITSTPSTSTQTTQLPPTSTQTTQLSPTVTAPPISSSTTQTTPITSQPQTSTTETRESNEVSTVPPNIPGWESYIGLIAISVLLLFHRHIWRS